MIPHEIQKLPVEGSALELGARGMIRVYQIQLVLEEDTSCFAHVSSLFLQKVVKAIISKIDHTPGRGEDKELRFQPWKEDGALLFSEGPFLPLDSGPLRVVHVSRHTWPG